MDQAPYANEMELYKVVIDKDGIIPKPEVTDERKFYVKIPTEAEFHSELDDFFFDTSYVIKSLYREEMLFTKYMFQILQKKFLEIMEGQYNTSKRSAKAGEDIALAP